MYQFHAVISSVFKFAKAPLLCRQQKLRLSGESPASPTIQQTPIFTEEMNMVGVAGSWGSGSKFIVASIK
jgi:hypothetical protein